MPISTFTKNGNYRIDLDFAVESQNQAGNYSMIYWRRFITKTAGTGYSAGGSSTHSASVWSNVGQIWGPVSGFGYDFTGGVPKDSLFDQGSFRVNHNDGGWAQVQMGAKTDLGTNLGFGEVYTPIRDLPRIPKPPNKPTKLASSELKPTSVKLSWSGSTDNGGSGISGYLLRYWPNAAGTGNYTDVSAENNTARTVSGLTPGKEYRFVVYAYNGSSGKYSPASDALVVRMLAGGKIKVAGIWRNSIVSVKVQGVWKMAIPYIKVNGVWKIGS